MRATIIDGKAVAEQRLQKLAERITEPIGLGILVATDDPATERYVAAKKRQGEAAGFRVDIRRLTSVSSLDEVIAACEALNTDDSITGYIVQLPLPEGVDADRALAAVLPSKDADGLTPENLERLYAGQPGVIPATPKGILTLLETYKIPVRSQEIAVVGQGRLTGAPLSALLEQRGARVTRCTKEVTDLGAATRAADIVVVAAGRPGLITADMVKEEVTVIDVGVTQQDGGIVGDVDFEAVSQKASAITPVPGGVGPMTVISLLENVADLAELPHADNGQFAG